VQQSLIAPVSISAILESVLSPLQTDCIPSEISKWEIGDYLL